MSTVPRELSAQDREKQAAARAAVELIESGQVVGLGSGSTASFAIRFLGERLQRGLRIIGVPTSQRTRKLAEQLGIPLTTLEANPQIDIDIDGADEVDPQLNLIKGGGGALLREKIIASASRRFIVVADSGKQVERLGSFPLPVEVIPFAETLIASRIKALGAEVALRRLADGSPFTTDEGHHILDCRFGSIEDPKALGEQLKSIPGIVEHGLFVGMAEMVFVAKNGSVVQLRR